MLNEIIIGLVFIFISGFGKVLYDKLNGVKSDLDREVRDLEIRLSKMNQVTIENQQKIISLEKEMATHTSTNNRIFEMLGTIQSAITNIEKLLAKNQIQ